MKSPALQFGIKEFITEITASLGCPAYIWIITVLSDFIVR